MSCGRSEPAGLCELRKQVAGAEERPLELRRKKGKENTPEERRRWGGAEVGRPGHAPEIETEWPEGRREEGTGVLKRELCWVLHLKGFY